VEMAAISISNAVDMSQREAREKKYMQIVGKYEKHEVAKFPEMLACVAMELEAGITDVLGTTYHELELHNKWAGQYFTPFELCRMMSKMTLHDFSEKTLPECGFVTVCEPACGSGAMVLAMAADMKESTGWNCQRSMHVTAVDVDLKCVCMAYLQFSLLHIPAVIVHGNSLSLEEWSHWYTPAHILDGWNFKLARKRRDEHAVEETPLELVAAVAAEEPRTRNEGGHA
jgi:type I restriction-modification system DNA methylase subunit